MEENQREIQIAAMKDVKKVAIKFAKYVMFKHSYENIADYYNDFLMDEYKIKEK